MNRTIREAKLHDMEKIMKTIDAAKKIMRQSECRQLLLSVRFIRGNKSMLAALQNKDWKTFARLYNGPAYEQNRYDEKLSRAYSSFSTQIVKLC